MNRLRIKSMRPEMVYWRLSLFVMCGLACGVSIATADSVTQSSRLITFTTNQTPRLTFFVDPALSDRAQNLMQLIEKKIETADAAEAKLEETLVLADELLPAVNRLLGVTPDVELANQQQTYFMFFSGGSSLRFAPPGELEITLVDRDNAKGHLRAGGSLPDITYDSANDTAIVQINRNIKHDSPVEARDLKRLTMVVMPDQTDDQVGQGYFQIVTSMQDVMLGLALHEVAEWTLLHGWAERRADPHWRWFSDGVANAVAYRVLRDTGRQEDEQAMRDGYRPEHYAEYRDDLNLRYWLEVRFEPPVNAGGENERRLARYTYATVEVERLIAEHGTEWIAEVLNQLRGAEEPGSAVIFDTIRQTTGVEIADRLEAYQLFADRDKSILTYAETYAESIALSNYDDAAIAAIRLLELQFTEIRAGPSPHIYRLIAKALTLGGHDDQARTVLKQIDELAGGTIKPTP